MRTPGGTGRPYAARSDSFTRVYDKSLVGEEP